MHLCVSGRVFPCVKPVSHQSSSSFSAPPSLCLCLSLSPPLNFSVPCARPHFHILEVHFDLFQAFFASQPLSSSLLLLSSSLLFLQLGLNGALYHHHKTKESVFERGNKACTTITTERHRQCPRFWTTVLCRNQQPTVHFPSRYQSF